MIVVSRLEAGGLQRVGGGIQRVRNCFPAIDPCLGVGPRQNNILAAQNQIQVAHAIDILRQEVVGVVVGGVTADAQVVQQFAGLLGLSLGPFEIGGVELNGLISHLSDGTEGGVGILLEGVAD